MSTHSREASTSGKGWTTATAANITFIHKVDGLLCRVPACQINSPQYPASNKRGRPHEQGRDQSGKLHGSRRKNTAADSILQAHPQYPQLFSKRIPALSGLGRGFDGRLNGHGALFFSRFDQPEFMSSVCFGPFEGGDEFGMGRGWSHEEPIPEPWTRC